MGWYSRQIETQKIPLFVSCNQTEGNVYDFLNVSFTTSLEKRNCISAMCKRYGIICMFE